MDSYKLSLKKFICFGIEEGYKDNTKIFRIDDYPVIIHSLEYLLNNNAFDTIIDIVNEYACTLYDKRFILIILARCCSFRLPHEKYTEFKKTSYECVYQLCKTSEELFMFIYFYNKLTKIFYNSSGWTSYLKAFIHKWYNNQELNTLVQNITICKQKYGWSHRNLIKLSHIKTSENSRDIVYKYLLFGKDILNKYPTNTELMLLMVYEQLKYEYDEYNIIHYIDKYHLQMEQLPSHLLKSPVVWDRLLKYMPLKSLLENITTLHDLRVFNMPGSMQLIYDKLNTEQLSPFMYFNALKQYLNHNLLTNNDIIHELSLCFYKAFNNLNSFLDVSTSQTLIKKNICLALNIENKNSDLNIKSMCVKEFCCSLAMMIDFVESDCDIVGLNDGHVRYLNLTAASCLEENMDNIDNLTSSNNCNEVFNKKYDVTILLTDKQVDITLLNSTTKYVIIYLATDNLIPATNLSNLLEISGIDMNIYDDILKFCQM